jgi:hypothetical protein
LLDRGDGGIKIGLDGTFLGVKLFIKGSSSSFKLLLNFTGDGGYSFIHILFSLGGDDVFTDIGTIFLDKVGERIGCANAHLK